MLEEITLLYVEDDRSISEEIVFFLNRKVRKIHVAYDGEEGLKILEEVNPDIIITDIEMPKLNGLDMIKEFKNEDKKIPIIITSAFSETEKLIKAIELGVDAYLIKPFTLKELLEKIQTLSRNIYLEKELSKMKAVEAKAKELALEKESFEKELKYQKLLEFSAEVSSIAFCEFDIKNQTLIGNDLLYKFLGTDIETENGYIIEIKSYLQRYVRDQDHKMILDTINKASLSKSKDRYSFEHQIIRRDGVLLDVIVDCFYTYDSSNLPDKLYGTIYNLKKQKEKEKELRDEKNRYQKLLYNQNILLSLFDKGDTVLFKWKNDERWTTKHVSANIDKLIPNSYTKLKSGLVTFDYYIHKDDLQSICNQNAKALEENKESYTHQAYRIVTQENEVKWVTANIVTQKDSQGNITHFIASVIDITDKRLTEKKIEKYLHLIDENILTSRTDLKGVIREVSSAFCKLTGFSAGELLGRTHSMMRDATTQDKVYQDMWKTITDDKIYTGEFKTRKKDGSLLWIHLRIFPIYNAEDIKTGYLGIKEDITDKKIVERLSVTDEMTKLYNRRHFNKVFLEELNRTKRDKRIITFVMIDIDNFKLYNDTYGHQNGDTALMKVAQVLKSFASRGGDYAFRLGGEEFGLILTTDNKPKMKQHIIHLIQSIEELRLEHKKNTASKYLTASAGVVFNVYDSKKSMDDLYKIADDALYQAKEKGRNQVVFNPLELI